MLLLVLREMMRTQIFLIIFLLLSLVRINLAMKMEMVNNNINNNEGELIEVKVGVILDIDRGIGKMGLRCIKMAISDFYASHPHYKTRLILHVRNSNDSVVGAATSALDLINNVKVKAIIGPVTSMQASFVINLGNEAQVPIISFSSTNPSLSSLRSEYFIRATLDDSLQLKAITDLIKAFGWRNVVPIYVDNDFGEGIIPSLNDALHQIGTQIPYRSVINPTANDFEIIAELYKLMTMQTRVFVLHMGYHLGSRVLQKARDIGMMSEGYVWIVTSGLTNSFSLIDRSSLIKGSLQGVLGIKTYVPKSRMLDDFTRRWKKNSTSEDVDVGVYGLWAYDAITSLAMAVEKVGCDSQTTDCSRNSVSLSKNLLEVLLSTRFKGLGGDFHIVNGELQSSGFEIINGMGNTERVIGFWTTKNGIVKELGSTEKVNLGVITWPGESKNVPKGWVFPTNGKKLRIGIPVKDGFSDFVKIVKDPTTNTFTPKGFCIDVFEAVIASLPYALPFDYIPFSKPNENVAAGTYNELVYQVFLGNFDAVVGDVTIRANRSLYVDFTLPFTESGVNMIVPVKDKQQNNAWVFLKPLTWDLWFTSFCFFIFIGFVIWILERKINEDLSGLGTGLWFSFSTMIFAHKEKVVSNFSRLVVIIWCFVVLILTQSYTASLTSRLTVKQLEPEFTSIEELVEKGEIVGYPKGSFVEQLLKNSNMTKLMPYNTTDELHIKFSNGEIAAAFDEIPYMKLFLTKYCSKYTIVGPTLKSDGFAFVFPKGSPLVPDISRAVLQVTEGEEMTNIERKWFGKQTICPDPSSSISAISLGMNSFWGLFVIVGAASSFALIIFTFMLVFENRHTLMRVHPKDIWYNITNRQTNGETDETNTSSNPNISNTEEETLHYQAENLNRQTSEDIDTEPQVVISRNQDESRISEQERGDN